MALVHDGSGQPSARYEYAPFGEPLRVTGDAALLNPFRFSTKYTDDETGLLYYGYRYYSPTLAKWLNRDPLEEEGGLNLYAFVENNPVNSFDPLGTTSSTEQGTAGGVAGGLGSSGVAGASWITRVKSAVNNLERIGDIMETAMDMMDFLPGDEALEFMTKMAEFRGDAVKEGMKNGHTNSAKKGQMAHNLLKQFLKKNGYEAEVGIGNGRADGIVKLAKKGFDLMIELKPNNSRAIARGKKQLAQYMKDRNQPGTVGLVVTY